mgnify:CR=1 FL=1
MQRILHTMLRVGNLQRSIDFYTQVIGMQVLRTFDQPEEKYSLTFLGFKKEPETCVLELTYNYGIYKYELGNAYGHIAIEVTDIQQTATDIKKQNVQFSLEPTRLKGGNETIAFLTDPDGYQVELIERPISWF